MAGVASAEVDDPVTAVGEFEAVLADRLRVHGPDRPSTSTVHGDLADPRGKLGDPAAAAADLTALLNEHVRLLGADHRGTADVRNDLAHWPRESERAQPSWGPSTAGPHEPIR
ncbi:hypothetical protein GCM10010492_60020 [Saccharothrix mutabilis subsp. mutabilis]|uniref:Uncharacterized protein n=1 Tax=Saccharothrix mutabilis subsp. mutabilis TaxID=66855 RepID=A0ABN0UIE2_9PSEU